MTFGNRRLNIRKAKRLLTESWYLTVVKSLKTFQLYLLGKAATVYTHHKVPKWLLTSETYNLTYVTVVTQA